MIWTRASVLEASRFDPAPYVRRALRATREALKAEKDGQVDHGIRLKAAAQIYDLAGVSSPERSDAPDPSKPLSVTIVLSQPVNGHAGAALQTHGVRLHLGSGEPG